MYKIYTSEYVESMRASGANYIDWDELHRLHCEEKRQMVNDEHKKAGRVVYDKVAADKIRADKAEATRLSIEKSRAARLARRAALEFSSQSDSDSSSGEVLLSASPPSFIEVVKSDLIAAVEAVRSDVVGVTGDMAIYPIVEMMREICILDVCEERGNENPLDVASNNDEGDSRPEEVLVCVSNADSNEDDDACEGIRAEFPNLMIPTQAYEGKNGCVETRVPLSKWVKGYKGPLTIVERSGDYYSVVSAESCNYCWNENGGCGSWSYLMMTNIDTQGVLRKMEAKRCCDGSAVCDNCPRIIKMRREKHCENIYGWSLHLVENWDSPVIAAFSPWWFSPSPRGYEDAPKWGDYYKDLKLGKISSWIEGYSSKRTVLEVCTGYCPQQHNDCELQTCYRIFPNNVTNIRSIIESKVCCDGRGCDECPRIVKLFPFFHCTCFEGMFVFHLSDDHKYGVCFSPWWSDVIDTGGKCVLLGNKKKRRKRGKRNNKAGKAKKKAEVSVSLLMKRSRNSTGDSREQVRDGVG